MASSTTEQEKLSIQERASRSWAANELQGVVDREGNEVGFIRPSVSDAASAAVRAEEVADGFRTPDEYAEAVQRAEPIVAAAKAARP